MVRYVLRTVYNGVFRLDIMIFLAEAVTNAESESDRLCRI